MRVYSQRSTNMKRFNLFERRTKIVCTIGLANGSAAVIAQLINDEYEAILARA
ncbi:MAG: hypothetical protein MUP49_07620 [Dehalococcoidia bacterium]|nr:hypothetical protein [Dehalococcoidia bacterium]